MEIRVTADDFTILGEHLKNVPGWAPRFVTQNMEQLGRRISSLMKIQVMRHHYTDALGESIRSVYNRAEWTLEIGPTAKRGSYDAGLLLQRGTRPFTPPFSVIAKWARFKGLPAGPVWMKIREKGIDAHPFLEETLVRGDTQVALSSTARRIGIDLAGAAMQVLPTTGGPQTMFGMTIQTGGAVFGGTP